MKRGPGAKTLLIILVPKLYTYNKFIIYTFKLHGRPTGKHETLLFIFLSLNLDMRGH